MGFHRTSCREGRLADAADGSTAWEKWQEVMEIFLCARGARPESGKGSKVCTTCLPLSFRLGGEDTPLKTHLFQSNFLQAEGGDMTFVT